MLYAGAAVNSNMNGIELVSAGIGDMEPTWRKYTDSARVRDPLGHLVMLGSNPCLRPVFYDHNAAVSVSSLGITRGSELNRIRNCTNRHLNDIVNLHRYRALFM